MINHLLGDPFWDEAEEVFRDFTDKVKIHEFFGTSILYPEGSTPDLEEALEESLVQHLATRLAMFYGHIFKYSSKELINQEIDLLTANVYSYSNYGFVRTYSVNKVLSLIKNHPELVREEWIRYLKFQEVDVTHLESESDLSVIWQKILDVKVWSSSC